MGVSLSHLGEAALCTQAGKYRLFGLARVCIASQDKKRKLWKQGLRCAAARLTLINNAGHASQVKSGYVPRARRESEESNSGDAYSPLFDLT